MKQMKVKDRCLVCEEKEEVFIRSPQEAGEYLRTRIFVPFDQFEQEELWVFPLNRRYRVTHQVMVYRGTIEAIQIRPAELFRLAVRLNAWGLLLAHNHPSGEATPSEGDLDMQAAVDQAGAWLGIKVVDHLIVGRTAWMSLRGQRSGS